VVLEAHPPEGGHDDHVEQCNLWIAICGNRKCGGGKWTLGPAFRFAYRPGQWNLGAVAVNLTSVGGDAERAEVNRLLIRGLIRRGLKNRWYFT
jgi:hypothetical protein